MHAFSPRRSQSGQRLRYNESNERFLIQLAGLCQAFEVSAIATASCKDSCKDGCPETYRVDKAVKSTSESRLVSVVLQITMGIGTALSALVPAVGDAIFNDGVANFSGATNAAVTVARKNPYTSDHVLLCYICIHNHTLFLSSSRSNIVRYK